MSKRILIVDDDPDMRALLSRTLSRDHEVASYPSAEAALEEIAAKHPDQTVVLVSHVVVCRLLLCAVLGIDSSHFWVFEPATASISVFEVANGRKVLLSFNDTCHLAVSGSGEELED